MPRVSKKDRERAASFVEWLLEQSSSSSASEFAQAAGAPDSTMSDWRRGKNIPSGLNLLDLMIAAGLLREDPWALLVDGTPLEPRQLVQAERALRELSERFDALRREAQEELDRSGDLRQAKAE